MYEALQSAVQKCQIRGLYNSAYWAAEQLLGCGEANSDISQLDDDLVDLASFSSEQVPKREIPVILMGSSLLALGEYERCANLFINKETHAIATSSPLALYLHCYSKYMSGEKNIARQRGDVMSTLKSAADAEDVQGNKKNATTKSSAHTREKNVYLPYLLNILKQYYHSTEQYDGFLLYLLALISSKHAEQYGTYGESQAIDPYEIYQRSVCIYPFNWSAWQDLAAHCLRTSRTIPALKDIAACCGQLNAEPSEGLRVMHAFFLTHIFLERHRGDLALQVLRGLHQAFPQSLYVYSQIGVSYYTQRVYDRAQECFEFIRMQDACRLQGVDVFSNILYVQEKHADLALLAHQVISVDKFSPEVCCVVGNHYSLKGQHDKAVVYFQRALRLSPMYVSAYTLMGHEFIELHNISMAIACYRQAVDIYAQDYRPWYGLGQTYEILHLYQYALMYYKKAAALRPYDARMWREGVYVYERALKAGDREGIATRELARIYRDEGEEEKSAELFYKYLLCTQQPQHPHTTAPHTTASSLSELLQSLHTGSTETQIAGDSAADGEQAEALAFLASYLFKINETAGAEYFCNSIDCVGDLVLALRVGNFAVHPTQGKLLGFGGPEGDEARLLLHRLHSDTYAQPRAPHSSSQPPHTRKSDAFFASPAQDINNSTLYGGIIFTHTQPHAPQHYSTTSGPRIRAPHTAQHPGGRRDSFDPFSRYIHGEGEEQEEEAAEMTAGPMDSGLYGGGGDHSHVVDVFNWSMQSDDHDNDGGLGGMN
eukprot:gene26318-31794_t